MAVGGAERLFHPVLECAMPHPEDWEDWPVAAKWTALDALRDIHDLGVLHNNAQVSSLFVRRPSKVGNQGKRGEVSLQSM